MTASPGCDGWRSGLWPSGQRGAPVALGRARAAEILRLAGRREGGEVELGSGLVAVCEAGFVRFRAAARGRGPGAGLARPSGQARIGSWELRAEIWPGPVEPAGPDLATLDARALTGRIEVRTWRKGDRMQPLGMSGTKTLQDVFTDRGVPRSLRHTLPVVTVDGADRLGRRRRGVGATSASIPRPSEVAVLTARALES